MTDDDLAAQMQVHTPAWFPQVGQGSMAGAIALLEVPLAPGWHVTRTQAGLKSGELLIQSTLAVLVLAGTGPPIAAAGVRRDREWFATVSSGGTSGLISTRSGDIEGIIEAWPFPGDIEGGVQLDGLRVWMQIEGLAGRLCASVGLPEFDEGVGLVRALSNLLLRSPIGATWIAGARHHGGDVVVD
jgi:hypothetical protein